MTVLHIANLQDIPILEQLQWEEALLRADNRNWCLINYGSPPAIVMGISNQIHELIDQEKLQKAPIPLIRRFSGGGTVVVDEKTFFVTFIFNAGEIDIPSFPQPIMCWTEQLYRPLFHPYSFSLQENDYVLGEKKFGGNAQSITKHRWLHHSSFLYDFNPKHMDYLYIPNKAPDYRKKRPHTDFLCCLKDYWPCMSHLKRDLIEHLNCLFHLKEVDVEELKKLIEIPHRKATKVELAG